MTLIKKLTDDKHFISFLVLLTHYSPGCNELNINKDKIFSFRKQNKGNFKRQPKLVLFESQYLTYILIYDLPHRDCSNIQHFLPFNWEFKGGFSLNINARYLG